VERLPSQERLTRTLLGPEGPDTALSLVESRFLRIETNERVVTEPLGRFVLADGQGMRHRPYFENYTVDASIL
jgi:hypothetical protein